MKKVKHEDHKWKESPDYAGMDVCEICGLSYQYSIQEPFYHYKLKIYSKGTSCEEIKMIDALE